MKLLAAISILTIAALLVILPQPSRIEKETPSRAGFRTEPVPAEPLVEIVPVGNVAQADLRLIADSVAGAFNVRTNIAPVMALPEAAWDEARRQYQADWILRLGHALKSGGAFRTILVTGADIYSGDLPFVISLIATDSKMAIISTSRLGGPEGVELPLEQVKNRVRRLAIRVLVASLKVRGCSNDCILAGRPTIENLDKSPDYFCPECAEILEYTLQTGIGSPYSYFMEALFHIQADDIDSAIEKLKKAIELKKNYLAAYLNLAELYVEKGWHAEAITTLRSAAGIAPANIEPRTRLAQVLLLNNQADNALEELSLALAIDPDSREVHRLLGITYHFYLDLYEPALAHYKRFLELGGDPELIKDLVDFSQEEPPPEKDK